MPHALKRLIVPALIVTFSAAQAVAEPAVVQNKVKFRSGPGPAFSTLGILPPGMKLDAQKCSDEWCRVRIGRQIGYVSRAFIKTGSDSYASAAPPSVAAPAPAPAAAPVQTSPPQTGARISRWHDSEWRDRQWRRIDWNNRFNND